MAKQVEVNEKIVHKLELRILLMIKENQATKEHTDTEMIKLIQKAIEEELK